MESLQNNLITVSQLVGGTSIKVLFDEEGYEIIRKESKK